MRQSHMTIKSTYDERPRKRPRYIALHERKNVLQYQQGYLPETSTLTHFHRKHSLLRRRVDQSIAGPCAWTAPRHARRHNTHESVGSAQRSARARPRAASSEARGRRWGARWTVLIPGRTKPTRALQQEKYTLAHTHT